MNNPNTNCLEGMACPSCGSYGPFTIEALVFLEVSDNDTEQGDDSEWNDDSYCRCHECGEIGTVGTFTEKASA